MRTLVINLTRFGDLIQTQPTLAGLAEHKGAGDEIGLVCLDNFAPAAELLPGVDRVYPIPAGSLLAGLDADWRLGLGLLWRWVAAVRDDFRPDRTLNLISALSSRLAARCLAGDLVQGFSLDDQGFEAHSTAWASFLSVASLVRGCSPYNLVDLFQRVSGLVPGRQLHLREPAEAAVQAMGARLGEMAPAACRGFVAFQLGASEERRTWPIDYFAALGRELHATEGLVPVLVGSGSEGELGTAYLQAGGGPCVDMIGKTSLPELAALLKSVRLLVTNDTGTMHLAAGLGVPLVAIFLATAQPWDTGPYLVGSLCLEPDLPCHPCGFGSVCDRDGACRVAIHPETVVGYVRAFLKDGRWGGGADECGSAGSGSGSSGARAWETVREDSGFMGLASLSGHESEERTQWVRVQRHLYSHFLDETEPSVWTGPRPTLEPATLVDIKSRLDEAAGLLQLLAGQAELLGMNSRPALRSKFLANWERVENLWKESRHLSNLGWLWTSDSQNCGEDLAPFLAACGRYRDLVRWMRTLLGDQ